MKMIFSSLPEFEKEYKRLSKKIPSLESDLENFRKFIVGVDFENNKRFILLKKNDEKGIRIIKTRLMVRSMKGSSKTRIIFCFCIRGNHIEFLEIYMKNEKDREDTDRIERYLKDR
ncbi:hypothetical protein HZA38_03440 [Candidatus Peregrinibacteria bacterium]|nr:hypothetical protein [Candidatus Peregrinibacteria bacterium]